MRAALGPAQRRDHLGRLRDEHLDVLVVGGGVVGTGAALDAATRGLDVGLVEARDWASGTSSRSSKLVHGGLRYLESYDFALVREALRERSLLARRLAVHLVSPVSFLYPLTRRVVDRAYVGAGVALYDVMAGTLSGRNVVPHHEHLSRRRALELAPALRGDALVGALRYYDAQIDDARHTMQLARTAAAHGAAVATSARVVGLLRDGDRVVGARVADLENGDAFDVRARVVVNATGVWTDDVTGMAGRGRVGVTASKGVHLVLPRDAIDADTAIAVKTPSSVLFCVPWGRVWLVGTTDTAWDLDKAHPAASSADIDYLLTHVNRVLATPLSRDDLLGVYAGLRPLLSGASDSDGRTSRLSREHAVNVGAGGLVTVAGGKYTTYRVMAGDAVDAAARTLQRRTPPSPTAEVPLVGADGYPAAWNRRARTAAEADVHPLRVEALLRRHGTLVGEVLDLVAADRSLAEPVPGAGHHLRAEVVYAAAAEGALHLEDVLTRRTRVSVDTPDQGLRAAPAAAELMAGVLGWDDHTRDREVAHYRARVEAERASQAQPDDASADAARLAAPDVRVGAG